MRQLLSTEGAVVKVASGLDKLQGTIDKAEKLTEAERERVAKVRTMEHVILTTFNLLLFILNRKTKKIEGVEKFCEMRH